MKMIGEGHVGGLSQRRRQGTAVRLAGKTAFLPNADVPFVMQELTLEQIEAVPKNKFSVSLIEPINPLVLTGRASRRFGSGSMRRLQRIKALSRPHSGGGIINFVRQSPGNITTESTNGTVLYNTVISLLDQAKVNVHNLYGKNLALSHNQRDTQPKKDSGIFCPPVDEDCMTDCITKAICHFFGNNDTCKIAGKEYKLVVFCLLMHDYFIRIHILKNTTRTPFGEYLRKSVLKEREKTFTSRTFTNCANDYKKDELDFTEPDRLKIDFRTHPTSNTKPLLAAFHEIGNFFHMSDYFAHLRALQENMAKFRL